MGLFSGLKNAFKSEAPKVACPKCGIVHEINADCKCPGCGLKYRLPSEYDVYIENARIAAMNSANGDNVAKTGEQCSDEALREAARKRKKTRSGTLIKLSFFAVLFSALFLAFALFFFKDKDALLFKTGEYVNQPVFYHTTDGNLHCVFPNNKSCDIGKGDVVSYLSSADGKCVYLTFCGEFASPETSNYVLRISKFGKKVEKISESKEYMPAIVSGGNNKYLYILTPKDEIGNVFTLTLTVDGEKPLKVADNVREIAVSTSGRYALMNLDENGASKMMVYSAAKNELINPGIKNAHPLSIDNKGEYMIYARKNTADSTDIIVEKSTTERIEIPILKDSALKSIILSEDRRTFAAEYANKTVFYTCTDKDYSISNTYEGSLFGYDFNENVCHNYLSFKEIPKISNVYGRELLPYYFYDKEHKFVYGVYDGSTRESVFDPHVIDELRVSDNKRCAFVSNDILYTGKLDKKNSDIKKIITFGDKTLIDISPDGKYVYYKDTDGNMFRAEYGKAADKPEKIAVDPELVKAASDSGRMLVVSDGNAEIIDSKGKVRELCEGIDIECSVAATEDLSRFFYTVLTKDENTGEEKRSLYLYSGTKSILVSDKLSDICFIKDSARFDITRSFYVDIVSDDAANENPDKSADTLIPAPAVQDGAAFENNAIPTVVPAQ